MKSAVQRSNLGIESLHEMNSRLDQRAKDEMKEEDEAKAKRDAEILRGEPFPVDEEEVKAKQEEDERIKKLKFSAQKYASFEENQQAEDFKV